MNNKKYKIMSFLKNLFNKNGDQLAREAIDDYSKGRDEFEVISKLQKAISLGIENYPLDKIYLHIGASYFDLSIYDKAKEAYEKAYEINPKNSSIISNLGLSYSNLGEPEKALKLYFNALEINPNHSFAYHNIGLYYYECGDHFISLEYLDKAITINPGLAVSYAVKARCLAHIGQYNEASKLIKEAKNRGYDNSDGLKRDINNISNSNPKVLWNSDKFISLATALSNENFYLLSDIQKATKDPVNFFKENYSVFESKHFNSFEINNLIPLNLLIDYLLDKNLLIVLEQNENGYNLISEIENLLNEKYSLDSYLFEDFKTEYLDFELDDLLNSIASRLKIQKNIEILDLFYYEDQLILTVIDGENWNKIKYPFSDDSNYIGRVRAIANESTINEYLKKL